MNRPRQMAFHYAIPVWGQPYVDLLLTAALPSLMAPGNLPAFSDRFPTTLCLYTTPEFVDTLRRSPVVRSLGEALPVDVTAVEIDLSHRYSGMLNFHSIALQRANAARAQVILQNADTVWADGSLAYAGDLISSGHRAILYTTLRVAKQPFVDCLRQLADSSERAISISPHDLAGLSLRCLHPYQGHSFWPAHSFNTNPTNFLWPVPGNGVIQRTMHMGPLVCITDSFSAEIDGTVDSEYVEKNFPSLGDCYVIENNDRFAVVDVTDLSDLAPTLEPVTIPDVLEVGHFMRFLGDHVPFGGAMLETPFHHRFGGLGSDWRASVGDSRKTVQEITAAARIMSAIETIDRWEASLAARLLAAALRFADLAKGPLARGVVTAFVPEGDEFLGQGEADLRKLLMIGNEKALASAVLQCVVGGTLRPEALGASGSVVTTLAGTKLRISQGDAGQVDIGEASVTAGPIETPGCLLYRTDRPVWLASTKDAQARPKHPTTAPPAGDEPAFHL